MRVQDPFGTFPLEAAIEGRARALGLDLPKDLVRALAAHARAVASAPRHLHLTSLREPSEFVDRHVGESLAGAAVVGETGKLLDLGSGNGYPGLAILIARPGLEGVLAEASARRADFLREVCAALRVRAVVLERQVQRAADVEALGPFDAICARAVGGWDRILPRLVPVLTADGRLLLWAGTEAGGIARRAGWSRLELEERRALSGRDRAFLWIFRSARAAGPASRPPAA